MPASHPGMFVDDVVLDEIHPEGASVGVLKSFQLCMIRPSRSCFQVAPARLRDSHIHGRGLFALHTIQWGQSIGEYEGVRVVPALPDSREAECMCLGVDRYFSTVAAEDMANDRGRPEALEGSAVIYITSHGNLTRFINHSCSPNAYVQEMLHGALPVSSIFAKHSILCGRDIC